MNIGIWTTWGQRCGVAAYSQNLARALCALGHTVSVVSNYPFDPVAPEELEHGSVAYCFTLPRDGQKQEFDFEKAKAQFKDCDGVVVQYQSSIHWKEPFFTFIRSIEKPIVMVVHDDCVWPDLYPRIKGLDIEVVVHHSLLQGRGDTFLPFPSPAMLVQPTLRKYPPAPVQPVLIRSFGFRTDDSVVRESAKLLQKEREGKVYYERLKSDEHWMPEETLQNFLDEATFVVLYYPPYANVFASSAAALAASSGTPVLTSGARCFEDYPFVTRCVSAEDLALHMQHLLLDKYEYWKNSSSAFGYASTYNFVAYADVILRHFLLTKVQAEE